MPSFLGALRFTMPMVCVASIASALLMTGCTDRLNTAYMGSNSTLAQSLDTSDDVANSSAEPNRYDWLRLAQRLGLKGGGPSDFDRLTAPRASNRNSFVGRTGNVSYPYGPNTSFPFASNAAGQTSFGVGGMNTSWPPGANMQWRLPGGGNTSLPYGGNATFAHGGTSYPAGGSGNFTYGQGRFVPPRGAGSRGLPLNSPNVTFGQGFPGFPGGTPNSTFPR